MKKKIERRTAKYDDNKEEKKREDNKDNKKEKKKKNNGKNNSNEEEKENSEDNNCEKEKRKEDKVEGNRKEDGNGSKGQGTYEEAVRKLNAVNYTQVNHTDVAEQYRYQIHQLINNYVSKQNNQTSIETKIILQNETPVCLKPRRLAVKKKTILNA